MPRTAFLLSFALAAVAATPAHAQIIGEEVGVALPLAVPNVGPQSLPRIFVQGGEYAVLYQDRTVPWGHMTGTRVSASGMVGAELDVDVPYLDDLACRGDECVGVKATNVAGGSIVSLSVTRFRTDGTIVGTSVLASGGEYEARIAATTTGFLVLWADVRLDVTPVLQMVPVSFAAGPGAAVPTPVPVSAVRAIDVACVGDACLIAWADGVGLRATRTTGAGVLLDATPRTLFARPNEYGWTRIEDDGADWAIVGFGYSRVDGLRLGRDGSSRGGEVALGMRAIGAAMLGCLGDGRCIVSTGTGTVGAGRLALWTGTSVAPGGVSLPAAADPSERDFVCAGASGCLLAVPLGTGSLSVVHVLADAATYLAGEWRTLGTGPDPQRGPSVAGGATESLVAFLREDSAGRSLVTSRVASTGELLDGTGRVLWNAEAGSVREVDLIRTGDGYAAAFLVGSSLAFARLGSDGALDGSVIEHIDDTASSASLAWNGTHFLVTWATADAIRAQRFDAIGQRVDETSRALRSTTQASDLDTSSDGEGWVIAWREGEQVRAMRVDATGASRDGSMGVIVRDGRAGAPAIAYGGGTHAIVWLETAAAGLVQSRMARFGSDGVVAELGGVVLSDEPSAMFLGGMDVVWDGREHRAAWAVATVDDATAPWGGYRVRTRALAPGATVPGPMTDLVDELHPRLTNLAMPYIPEVAMGSAATGTTFLAYTRPLAAPRELAAARVRARIVRDDRLGAACDGPTACASGACVDGICCDSACDGVCEACGTDGVCAAAGAGTECRASVGACDVAEACDGTSRTCPADAPSACDGGVPGLPDAASADGGAGSSFDAGGSAPPSSGGCSAGRGAPPWWSVLACALALAFMRRRRS